METVYFTVVGKMAQAASIQCKYLYGIGMVQIETTIDYALYNEYVSIHQRVIDIRHSKEVKCLRRDLKVIYLPIERLFIKRAKLLDDRLEDIVDILIEIATFQ